MRLHVNKEDQRIEGYTIFGNDTNEKYDYIEVDFTENDIPEDLIFSRYIDGEIVLDSEFKEAEEEAMLLESLRAQREVECFPIINRGKLWYDNLTVLHSVELQEWYQAWLDVTETKVIPQKPEWLV